MTKQITAILKPFYKGDPGVPTTVVQTMGNLANITSTSGVAVADLVFVIGADTAFERAPDDEASPHKDYTSSGGVLWYEAGPNFSTRARMVAAKARMDAAGDTVPVGTVWIAHGLSYLYDGVASMISDMSGWKPIDATLRHFGAVGDWNGLTGTDDTAALLAAFSALQSAEIDKLEIPDGRFKCTSNLSLSVNNFVLVGVNRTTSWIDFAGSAAKLDVATSFNFVMGGFTVTNSAGDAVVIGETTGPQTYCAYFRLFDIATNFSGGRGIAVGDAYMGDISGLRAQNATGISLDFGSGFKTSLDIRNCHALDGGGDGWRINSMTYSRVSDAGADRNGGYGYNLQNLRNVELHLGAEQNDKAAMLFYYNSLSSSFVKGFEGVTVRCYEKDNNALGSISMGSLAYFEASPASASAGTVTFDGCSHFSPPAGQSVRVASGNYKIIAPASRNNIKRDWGNASFSVISDGAGDVPNGLPTNVTGANTPIANLRPKFPNGVTSYGGLLTVYVTKNNLDSASRSATYSLLLTRAAGTSSIVEIAKTGNTTGGSATDASFTFSLDAANHQLEVTPVGFTATGNWYFHVTAHGNINVEPI